MPFICSIDCVDDYRKLFGDDNFSWRGFQLLLDYHDGMAYNLDEMGRLSHYWSEFESLRDACDDVVDEDILKKYDDGEMDDDELLDWCNDNDIVILYDGVVAVRDDR